jgi:hypothetical protein
MSADGGAVAGSTVLADKASLLLDANVPVIEKFLKQGTRA